MMLSSVCAVTKGLLQSRDCTDAVATAMASVARAKEKSFLSREVFLPAIRRRTGGAGDEGLAIQTFS